MNRRVVWGCISNGLGARPLNSILATMNPPGKSDGFPLPKIVNVSGEVKSRVNVELH